jgi:hypothetical protein
MVFSINAADTGPNNVTAFQALAKQITYGTQAGSAAPLQVRHRQMELLAHHLLSERM